MSVKDNVEELATAQAKEEATSSLRVGDVGAPATLGTFACGPRGRAYTWTCLHLIKEPLGKSGLKEVAAEAVEEQSL
jgi:hypothetical protein